jgi:hypothetical protein
VTKLVPRDVSENEPPFRMYGVDTTPETPSQYSEDFALLPGRSWTSPEGGVHVTALEVGEREARVRVELGAPPNASPEIRDLSARARGADVLLEVDAVDPDGDLLEVFWSFVGSRQRYATEADYARGASVERDLGGRPRRVYAVVSDGRGGVTWGTLDLFGYRNAPPALRAGDLATRTGLRSWAMNGRARDRDLLWWDWSFGDGTSSRRPSPEHTYAEPGRYTVRARVSDGTETAEASFVLDATATENTPPIADAGPDVRTTTGETALDGTGSRDPDGHPGPLRFFWSAPRGVEMPSTRGQRPRVRSTEEGTFTITLEVNDGAATDRDTVDVTLE